MLVLSRFFERPFAMIPSLGRIDRARIRIASSLRGPFKDQR